MTSGLFSSLQSLSGKLLDAIRGIPGQEPNKTDLVEEDLKRLNRMLLRIQAVQQDAEEKEIRDRSVQLWLRELRGVAHEAEDVLDEFNYDVLKSIVENRSMTTENSHTGGNKSKIEEIYTQSSSLASSSIVTKIMIPDGMIANIKRITNLFEEITKAREYLQLRPEDGERRVLGPRRRAPTSSHVDEKGLFGRENEKEEIISLLNPDNGPDFMVVPIVGKGGLGKTTLAQLVYNDPKVCRLFNKKAWVSVGEDFDLVHLTKAVIESVIGFPCDFSELNNLQDALKKNLRGTRLFLVLDDVWNEEKNLWERFRIIFNGTVIVRILSTTRSYYVARIMQTMPPFSLGHLPEEECWVLFKCYAFGNEEENEHVNLLEIGCDIVRKCNGLPLAVKVLGGLLRYETSEEKWREILESDIWVVEQNEIMPVLMLSYNHLPFHLRPCFLYLSTIPKDTPFYKEEMIRIWIAQGYISSRSKKTLEDIGGEYFEELQCRSLVDFKNHYGFILHDLIHDLATFINEKMYPTFTDDEPHDSSFPVYHLYLHGQNTIPSYAIKNNYRSIRTLLHYKLDRVQIDYPISLSMACLRVLELYTECIELSNGIGILKHLRHLKLEGDSLRRLPESLCVLYNLQILDLSCSSLRELPRDIGNLINLWYLLLECRELEQLPRSIWYLGNLEILKLTNCKNLKKLPNGKVQLNSLRLLELPRHTVMKMRSIGKFTNLQTIKLPCQTVMTMPSEFGKLTNLQTIKGSLTITSDAMNGDVGELKGLVNLRGSLSISGLGNITDVENIREADLRLNSNLEALALDFSRYNDYFVSYDHEFELKIKGRVWESHNGGCSHDFLLEILQPHINIKTLIIREYRGIKFPSWMSDPIVMPNLAYLNLTKCDKCNFLPPLGLLPSLKILWINCSRLEKIEKKFCGVSLSNVAFPALEELVFHEMFQWEEWIGVLEGDFPRLKELSIRDCSELLKIPTIPKKLERLKITNCGIDVIQFALPSNIQCVHISGCKNLTSLIGLPNHSLKELHLIACLHLEISIDFFLQSTTTNMEISTCFKLNNTMLENIYFYKRDVTLKVYTPDTYDGEVIRTSPFILVLTSEVLANPLLKPILFRPCVLLEVPLLEKLENFWGSWTWTNYEYLKHLLILGCSKLRQCDGLPPFIEYLEVSCCAELITIPALDKSKNLLEIRISKCPKLNAIRGLHGATSLKTLLFEDCEELRALPCEKLQNRVQTVEVCDCPLMRDWCQLNNFAYSGVDTEIHHVINCEGSGNIIDSANADAEAWDLDLVELYAFFE